MACVFSCVVLRVAKLDRRREQVWRRLERAQQSMPLTKRLVDGAAAKVESVWIAAVCAVAKDQPAQPFDLEKRATFVNHVSKQCAGCRIKGVDTRVVYSQRARIPDQQQVTKRSEGCRRDDHSPGIGERTVVNRESRITYAVGIKLSHETVIKVGGVLKDRVTDIQRAAQILNIVRMKVCRDGSVGKITRH